VKFVISRLFEELNREGHAFRREVERDVERFVRDEIDESGEGMRVTDNSSMNFGCRGRGTFRRDGREILVEEIDDVDDSGR